MLGVVFIPAMGSVTLCELLPLVPCFPHLSAGNL